MGCYLFKRNHTSQTQRVLADQTAQLASSAADGVHQAWGSTAPPGGQSSSHKEAPHHPAKRHALHTLVALGENCLFQLKLLKTF